MAPARPAVEIERRRLEVEGVVQGVGFRPFVHGLAHAHGLGGFVLNTGSGVTIEAEGLPCELDAFAAALVTQAPPLARVQAVAQTSIATRGDPAFAVAASRAGGPAAALPADVATCEDCLRELFDPSNRRFRHPFISCTQCGPRFTIVERVPYDRHNTTMADFQMCDACRAEYEDPGDRRFHAEPIACNDCGPSLSMAVDEAGALLRDGSIVAVKGIGGYHLACRAADEAAVARLRARKHREDKPFAVMSAEPSALVFAGDDDAALLASPARPIVLLPRRPDAPVAPSVAPGSPWLGVMLPYSPLHHMLLAEVGEALVMTSANRSDEPIAVDDADALDRLAGIADALLGHDRRIHRRCEDSVIRRDHIVRRSRGFAPASLPLPVAADRPLVAVGAQLKNTFCVARGREAFLSPHLGDLDDAAAGEAFSADLAVYLAMLGIRPDLVAHDLHPDYRSTHWALGLDAELVGVQHHHAHAAACLAEHGREGPALAVVFDGAGYGPDGTIWGGELLRCDLERFERVAHLEPVPLPGGDAAIRQPWRAAAAYLERAGRPVPFARWPLVRQSLAVNAPLSSGAGRLFDAIAALLGVREEVTYEGQAAIELEQLGAGVDAEPYPCRSGNGVIAGHDLVAAAHDDLQAGRPRDQIAAAFHEGLAAVVADACEAAGQQDTVVLSGGTFQNLRLRDSLRRKLETRGFEVLTHRRVPPGDGGISFGQAAIAARRTCSCA